MNSIIAALLALSLAVWPGCKAVPTVAPGGAVITIFADPGQVEVQGTARVVASVFEASGQPVPDGTEVTFTTDLGSVNPPQASTAGGFVIVTYRAGTTRGTAVVTARSGGVTGSVSVVVGGTAAVVSVTANPATLPAGGGSTTITATVRDANGTPIGSLPVTFSTDHGSLASGGRAITTASDGRASDTLTTTVDATVTATAGTSGGGGGGPTPTPGGTPPPGAGTGSVFVDVAGSGAASLTLEASPTSLGSGGGSVSLRATVLDALGNPVPSFAVAFSTTAGALARLGVVRTDGAGVAANTLTTSTTATVTATGAGVTGMVTVTVGNPTPGALVVDLVVSPSLINRALLTATPTPVPACADSTSIDVTLTATVTSAGSPVQGALVVFFVERAADDARVVGRFCEIPPQVATNSQGVSVVHYSVAQLERDNCIDIGVPCAGSACSSTSPCVTPTPTPTPTPPTPTPTPFPSLINQCCCGIFFVAQVGSASDRSAAFPILAEQDCQLGGRKLCNCLF